MHNACLTLVRENQQRKSKIIDAVKEHFKYKPICATGALLGRHSVPTEAISRGVGFTILPVVVKIFGVDVRTVSALEVPQPRAAWEAPLGTPQSGQRPRLVASIAFALRRE